MGEKLEARKNLADIARLFRFLLPHVLPHKRLLALALLFTLGYAATIAVQTWLAAGILQVFMKAAKEGSAAALTQADILALRGDVQFLAIFAAFIALSLGATDYFKEYFHQSFVLRVVISIRETLARHLLSLSMRFFHRRRMGDLYSRLMTDVNHTQQGLSFLFGDIVEDVIKIAALVVTCVIASPLLSLVVLVLGPAVIWPLAVLGQKLRKRARLRQGTIAEVTESLQQMLTGMRTVKAFGTEEREMERLHGRNEDLYRANLRVTRVRAMARGLLEAINHGLMPFVLLGGIVLVQWRWLAPSDLAWFIVALVRMYEPAKRATRSYSNLQESLAGLDRLEELLAETGEVRDAPDARPLADVRGDVALRGVSFAHASEPVLRDVTLEARRGEVVALVGPSGGGKSTLLDLVARFYDPDAGAIEVDGQDLRKVTRASLLASLGIVTQDPFLFNDTILENVRYGRRDATMDEVIAACKAASIHDAIAALPAGYETVVGERGATLSGGQRQRITIARALLKDPKILLLDEATSALDSESERVVQEALDRLMKGRTTLVVAHRLSTVVGATRIVVLEAGRVVEQGTHEELLARGGLYAKYHALQAGVEHARAAGAAAAG